MTDTYALVTNYPIESYTCGLKAGDKIRLKKDIIVRKHTGEPTGEIIPSGEMWTVLSGADSDPIVVWLRQENGETHTWDDDESIFEYFEKP